MSICPALVPVVGNATCTEFGAVSFMEKFSDDVLGAPVASPGRMEMNPSALGETAVTFNSTPVAPAGTTIAVPAVVAIEPVIFSFCDTDETNGPGNPTFTGSRVSNTRTGSMVTTDDGALVVAALATNTPPPPIVTATAAPIAAQRLRRTLWSWSFICLPFVSPAPTVRSVGVKSSTYVYPVGSIGRRRPERQMTPEERAALVRSISDVLRAGCVDRGCRARSGTAEHRHLHATSIDDCVWLPAEQIEVDGHVVVTYVLPDNGSELVLLNERTCETWPSDPGY